MALRQRGDVVRVPEVVVLAQADAVEPGLLRALDEVVGREVRVPRKRARVRVEIDQQSSGPGELEMLQHANVRFSAHRAPFGLAKSAQSARCMGVVVGMVLLARRAAAGPGGVACSRRRNGRSSSCGFHHSPGGGGRYGRLLIRRRCRGDVENGNGRHPLPMGRLPPRRLARSCRRVSRSMSQRSGGHGATSRSGRKLTAAPRSVATRPMSCLLLMNFGVHIRRSMRRRTVDKRICSRCNVRRLSSFNSRRPANVALVAHVISKELFGDGDQEIVVGDLATSSAACSRTRGCILRHRLKLDDGTAVVASVGTSYGPTIVAVLTAREHCSRSSTSSGRTCIESACGRRRSAFTAAGDDGWRLMVYEAATHAADAISGPMGSDLTGRTAHRRGSDPEGTVVHRVVSGAIAGAFKFGGDSAALRNEDRLPRRLCAHDDVPVWLTRPDVAWEPDGHEISGVSDAECIRSPSYTRCTWWIPLQCRCTWRRVGHHRLGAG